MINQAKDNASQLHVVGTEDVDQHVQHDGAESFPPNPPTAIADSQSADLAPIMQQTVDQPQPATIPLAQPLSQSQPATIPMLTDLALSQINRPKPQPNTAIGQLEPKPTGAQKKIPGLNLTKSQKKREKRKKQRAAKIDTEALDTSA